MKKMKLKQNSITCGNVLDDIGLAPEVAEVSKLKLEIHNEIIKRVKAHAYTQKDLQNLFRQQQPTISTLLAGKISRFSIEMLLFYLSKLGASAKLRIRSKRRAA